MIAIYSFYNTVVQSIYLLEKIQLLLYLEKLRILGNWQTKKLLSPSIGDVFPIDIIKLILIKTQVKKTYQNNLYMNTHAQEKEDWKISKSSMYEL